MVVLAGGVARIELDATPAAALRADEAIVWEAACAANSRLHDGGIAALVAIEQGSPVPGVTIRLRRERYARLVIDTPGMVAPTMLGVKGVLIGRDAQGEPHVFIQRRHAHTRVYPGCWEIGPGGGLDVSGEAIALTPAALVEQLRSEIRGEMGLDAATVGLGVGGELSGHSASFGLEDRAAQSFDVCFVVAWPGVIDAACPPGDAGVRDWEVTQTAWLAKAEAAAWVKSAGERVAPPMRAILRHLGWQ